MTTSKLIPFRTVALRLAILAALRVSAQTNSPPGGGAAPVVVMPSFEVSDTKDRGYLAANSVSATRIETPIKDLPFAVSAFTSQFISDIGARDLYDVVKYSSGVQSGSSEFLAGNTSFSIRGFKQFPEHDGFNESSHGNVYVDTANVERVEVVKGPAALLYGAIAPGGTVNYITKKAQPAPSLTLGAQYGSFNFARATLDLNQPLVAEKLLFRFNAAAENGSQWVEGTNSRTFMFDPTFTWNIKPGLSLRVNYQYFHRNEDPPAYPLPQMEVSTPGSVVASLTPGNGGPTAALTGKTGIDAEQGYGSDGSNPGFLSYYPRWPTNQNYLSNGDSRSTDLQSVDIELDTKLGTRWTSRLNFNYNHVLQKALITGQSQIYLAPPDSLVFNAGKWSVAPAWNALTPAQQLASELTFAQQILADPSASLQLQNGVEAPGVIPKVPQQIWAKGNTRTFQWEAGGQYDFNWGKVKLIGGLFYDTSATYSHTGQNTGGAASPYFQNWDVNPLSPTYFISRDTKVNPDALTNIATDNLAWISDQAVYSVINANLFHDRLYLVGGARYNRSQSQTTNFIAPVGTSAIGQGYKASRTTPQVGVGYKLLRNLMVYASYSTAYSLPTTPFLSTIQTVNGVLKSVPTTQAVPTTAESYEVGIKTDFLNGRVSSTLSVYDIRQRDVVQTVNSFINGTTLGTSVQQTRVESKGIEYEITWSPLDNWQVFASISEDDARNTAEPAGYQYYLGEPPAYTSKTLGNLWTRYSFRNDALKGLWIGAGFNYQGRMQADTVNKDNYFPPATIWNATLGYDLNWHDRKLNFALKGENLTDKFYVPATQVRSLPRRATFSVTTRF